MVFINDILKMLYSIDADIEQKKWVRGIVKCLLLVIVGACTVLCILWFIAFLFNHIDYVIIVVGGIGSIILLIRSALPERPKQREKAVYIKKNESMIGYDTITLESTYKRIREGMFHIITETADLIGVKKPTSSSQMDAPTHYDIISNVPVYHLLVAKIGGENDVYTIMGLLQNVLEQKLNDNEFNGISQTVFFHNGQAYPSIMIDNVRNLGNMLQIDVVIVSGHYCRYRERRMHEQINKNLFDNPRDDDF